MGIAFGLVGLTIGGVSAWLYFRNRDRALVTASQQHEGELKAILDEVRELRLEIDILKVNPTIGDAVKETLKFAHKQVDFEKSAYNVATTPGKLPASAYDVLVRPGRLPEGDPP